MLYRLFLIEKLCSLRPWIGSFLLCGICLPVCASGYFYDYAYGGPYYGIEYRSSSRYDAELSRLRDSLRAGHRRLREQEQQQAAQLRLLNEQVEANYRVSASQACYYRVTGGYEACEDMFVAGSENHVVCEEKVRHRNPGCAP